MKHLVKIVFNDFYFEKGFEKGFNAVTGEIFLILTFLEMEDTSWSVYIDSSSLCCHGDYYTAKLRFLVDGDVPVYLLSDKSRFDLCYLKTPVGHGEILGKTAP